MSQDQRPLLLQLWTVRRELERDFRGTIRRLAELGLNGVEPFNNQELPFDRQAGIIREAGLELPAAHLPLPHGEQAQQSLEAASQLGVKWLVSGFGPEAFQDARTIEYTARRASEAADNAEAAGFGFALHNHWWEFGVLPDGSSVWDRFLPLLQPNVRFEIDTYWARVAGRDPVQLLEQLGERVPLVHLKDGSAVQGEPMLALGDGVLDVPALVAAARSDWLVIELDEFDGNMLEAVAGSVDYLRAGRNRSGRTA